ncbi:cation transporter [Mycoplasmatota bacterium]|nr:cation transporter [Mycoplasmatota bacterium]
MERMIPMSSYKKVSRILTLVLLANLFIAIMKLVVGYLVKSESISADGLHSLTDSTSNIIGLIGIRIASKPADTKHPYGYKKYESLSGLFIGVMLIFVTVKIVWGAIQWFFNPYQPNITIVSLIVMIITLIINITISSIEYKKAKEYNSAILLSDSMNTRSDILVSSSVLITIIAIKLGISPIIDPISSLIVAAVIVYASIEIFKSTTDVLVDRRVLNPERIKEIVLAFPEVKFVDKIRSRGRKDEIFIDLHIKIDPDMHIMESHRLNHEIEEKLKNEFDTNISLIAHLEPSDK